MYVTVEEAKSRMHVIHSADDQSILLMIEEAEDEALRYLNREYPPTLPLEYPAESSSDAPYSEEIPSSEDPIAPSFRKAVLILVEAAYAQPDPDKQSKMREAALNVLQPYRNGLGI